jgi:hypothetical protein
MTLGCYILCHVVIIMFMRKIKYVCMYVQKLVMSFELQHWLQTETASVIDSPTSNLDGLPLEYQAEKSTSEVIFDLCSYHSALVT